MADNMILIMVDECGEETEVATYTIGDDLDEDYIELWKDKKIADIQDRYPEAQRFYFEDRRNWKSLVNRCIHDPFFDPCF